MAGIAPPTVGMGDEEKKAVLASLQETLKPTQDKFLAELLAPSQKSPELLFHYTDGPGLLGIVKTNRLWASDLFYMNDSTEIEYGRSLILDEAAKAAGQPMRERLKGLFTGMEYVVYPVGTHSTFYAACFCEHGDLLSQWRGYSGGIGGYSLGIIAEELGMVPKDRPDQRYSLWKVLYSPVQQRQLLSDLFNSVIALLEGAIAQRPAVEEQAWIAGHNVLQYSTLQTMAMFKNPKFEAEQEWRLVRFRSMNPNLPQVPVEYRATRAFIVPYISLDVTPMAGVNANRIPLGRVVVGPTPHPKAGAESVKALLHDSHAFTEVVNSEIPLRA